MDNEITETLKSAHKARGEVYNFFDKFFRLLPDEEFYHMVEQNLPRLKEISEGCENEDMREGVAQLQGFFAQKAALDEKEQAEYLLEALRRYTSLFCLTNSVPATESYYTSAGGYSGGYSMDEAYGEMRKIIRKHGFKRSKDVREYEDHISVESAFMAKLARMTADMLDEGNIEKYNVLTKEQLAFHKNHFDGWISAFVGLALAYPVKEQVFKPMIRFLKGYLVEDKQFLSEIIEEFI
jgi:TorA maturation chaperone TorD